MITIKRKSDCSGCHACVNICPKSCISMKTDEEGFWYPHVDKALCINCGMCKKVCHHSAALENSNTPTAYACYNQDETVRLSSSSGGMFTLFAEYILDQGGVVFGAAFDEHLQVKHICVTDKADLHLLRGSKYVQSCIGDSYKLAKSALQKGQLVFFTGTPCQIGGLLLYLGKTYDTLYTADIICHGVPSPKVWQTYIEHLETKHNSKIDPNTPPSFRSKVNGWLGFSMKIQFQNQEEHCAHFMKDRYMNAFINDLTLRPSCYRCEFKTLNRQSDVTLADFWGVKQLVPEMFDDQGTSLLLINSQKGAELLDQTRSKAIIKPVALDIAIKQNPAAHTSPYLPFKRKKFIKQANVGNFSQLAQRCENKSFFEKVYHKLNRMISRHIK